MPKFSDWLHQRVAWAAILLALSASMLVSRAMLTPSSAADDASGNPPAALDPTATRMPIDVRRVEDDTAPARGTGASISLRFLASYDLAKGLPIFVPSKLADDFRSGFQLGESSNTFTSPNEESGIILLDDSGYSAWTEFGNFQLSIQGTSMSYQTAPGVRSTPDYYHPISYSELGGEITFGYAGASYLLVFSCHGGDAECVSPQQAEGILQTFLICGTKGRCAPKSPATVEKGIR